MLNEAENISVISGLGIVSSIGNTLESFWQVLLSGASKFSLMKRLGRGTEKFIGAELENFTPPELLKKHRIRDGCFAAQVAVTAINEAWNNAQLNTVDPEKIGLVVGGTNFAQRENMLQWQKYRERPEFTRPSHARNFMDTDICGICTQIWGIRGMAYTIGGASSSGQLAVIQAHHLIATKQLDVCIAVGALMDISEFELHAFQSVGAMASLNEEKDPVKACRPFDKDHKGFVYGENCAVLIIESLASAEKRGIKPLAKIAGTGIVMDGNRETNPSKEGEIKVIRKALAQAKWQSKDIDIVNPHGTGSRLGDDVELQALREAGLAHAFINTTKSITGHGLTAAGAVELVTTVLQLQYQQLHPSLNLSEPIGEFNWVKEKAISHEGKRALSLSMGFGGINTAVCLEKF